MGLTKEELAILVTGKDVSATRTLRGVNRELNRTAAIAGKAGRNLGRNIERGVVIGVTAAAGAIGYAVKQAGDFEAQLNTINTIARATPDALNAIGDQVRQIARDTGTPLEELTQGYYDLLSAGIKTADAQGVLTAANKLAIGGLATTAETVDLLTTAINTYGGDATKAGAYADYFAKAVERGKVTADEIAASFAQVGPIAASSGIEIEEIAASYARLTAAGVPAAEASTQMRSAIVGLMKVTSPLGKLQKQTGRNYFAIAGKKGLVYALQLLRQDADKAGVPLIKLLGRVEGVNFALQTTGPNFDAYNADLAAVGDSAGTAAEQMGERQKGLNYELGKLKANVTDAAITIGTQLLPVFADLAAEGTDWLKSHQPEIAQFARDLADGIRDAVTYAKSLDWNAIASALGAGADAVKTIVSTFLAMPPGLQGLLVGGYAANKVTGGAVGDLVGVAVKGALSQLIQRGSSPANPLFVVPIGGGLGGGAGVPGVAGAGAGILGGVLRAAGLGIGVGSVLGSNAAEAGGGVSATGFLGNAGGGALAGASVAGPLGALVGGTLGVIKSVAEVESQRNTESAQTAHGSLSAMIAGGANVAQLSSALGAIDKGIADLRSNPLNVLVQGDALAELEAMHDQVAAALETRSRTGGLSPDERQARSDQIDKLNALDDRLEAVKDHTDQVRAAVTAAKVNQIAAQRTGDASIVAAIRGLDVTTNLTIPIDIKGVPGRQTIRVTQTGTTLHRYNGKLVPID